MLLLPAPTARNLEKWDFEARRQAHFARHGYPDWEKRHGQSTVMPVVLGRQLIAGHYARNSRFDPDALHVELSIDQDHLVVRNGQDMQSRMTRMFRRLKACADRQAAKVVTTPKVLALPSPVANPVVVEPVVAPVAAAGLERKLRAAWQIIREASSRGEELLFWAVETYDARTIYQTLMDHGYVWDRRAEAWGK